MKKQIPADLFYKLDDDGLLYLIKYNNKKCLCISNMLIKDIFKIAHDEMGYYKFNKIFKRLHGLAINKTNH